MERITTHIRLLDWTEGYVYGMHFKLAGTKPTVKIHWGDGTTGSYTGNEIIASHIYNDKEPIMKIQGWNEECEVLKLEDDDYYSSDFQLMCELLNEMQYSDTGQAHAHSYLKISDVSQGNTAPGHDWNRTMEDGTTWAEGPLRHPALDHICICWPIHDLCTHTHYSIPDLLRINDFKSTVTLTVEHMETQSGIRSFQPGYRPWMNADITMESESHSGLPK